MGKLKISFGICFPPEYNREYLLKLIQSIYSQANRSDVEYEIIIIGDYKFDLDLPCQIYNIKFDETLKKGWITRKKNLLTLASSYDIVCLLHDYYQLDDNWMEGLIRYTNENPNWNVLSNKIIRYERDRHSDWLVNQKYMDQVIEKYPELSSELIDIALTENNGPRWVCGLPYDEMGLKHLQYISGGYILTRKRVLLQTPFDESIGWGEAAEDIIWSESLIEKGCRFDFNPYSTVTLQKPGKWKVYQMTDKCVDCLKEIFGNGK